MMDRVPIHSIALKLFSALLWLAPLVMAGCALQADRLYEPPPRFVAAGEPAAECARFLSGLDRDALAAGVADGQEARIGGFPYLRINRFLAGDWRPGPDEDAYAFWVKQLRDLDSNARRLEIENLLASVTASGTDGGNRPDEIFQRAEACAELLMARDLADSKARHRLHGSAWVPDDYRLLYRIAGIYPLTSIPFFAGVSRLHEAIHKDFAPPLDALPGADRLVRFVPGSAPSMSAAEIVDLLRRASDNPLALPQPSNTDRDRLFQNFAPVFEVDVAHEDDRIGFPRLSSDSIPFVDVAQPVVFTYTSHVRFDSKSLLQLNFVVWFPARTSSGALDILAGRLDGINWRVTLDEDGRPLLYDSMHNCGCYHQFFPSDKLQFDDANTGFEEPVLIPQTLPWSNKRLVIRVAHRTHYIQRVYFDQARGGEKYRLSDYDVLRSLELANQQRRSLFGADGLVAGTERAERWLFWPMGIESPGAMRQRGRHATAFVGRRHFDDPGLISRYFRRRAP